MKLTSDNTAQPEFDAFSAPIPGQSLTDEPGNYPWEHAPKNTDPETIVNDLLFEYWSSKIPMTVAISPLQI